MPERKSHRFAPVRGLAIAAVLAASLATASPAGAAQVGAVPDLTWGTSRSDVDRTVNLMRAAGVRWVRMNVPWNALEPSSKGSYNAGYLSEIDYAVDEARAAGIQVLMPIADGVPYWASADPNKASGTWNRYWRPTSFADYADFVRFVVDRYSAKGVHAYEIWNEPNLSWFWPSGVNAGEYVQMLEAGYAAVKEADPTATVVLGGLSKSDYAYLEAVYAAGGGAYFDVVAIHPYTGKADPTWCWGSPRYSKEAFCAIEEVRKTMVANGDAGKQIWLTEFGWGTGTSTYSVSESDQAAFLTKALKKLESYPYVATAFYYNFRNSYWYRDDPKTLNANMGLLRTDFSAKPAYAAFKAYALAAPPPPPPGSPVVDLVAPTEGSKFSLTLDMHAVASDDVGVDRVEFRLDGQPIVTLTEAPYAYTWTVPSSVRRGLHTLEAVAFDGDGLSATDSVSVSRVKKRTKTKIAVARSSARTLSAASSFRKRLIAGRVKGGATAGRVVVRLQRYRPARGRWGRVVVRKTTVTSAGTYTRRLRLRPGLWRARAGYRGTTLHAPSRSARVTFRVRR